MLPTLVLVGRPNVGKSTLFNRLTQSRDALVADFPGLTRDRHFGRGRGADRPYLVVDTGGFEPKAKSGIMHAMAKQTRQAIAESDAVIFLVDGREGLTAQDSNIADLLRRSGRPVVLAVNKAEGTRARARHRRVSRARAGHAAADLFGARRKRARSGRTSRSRFAPRKVLTIQPTRQAAANRGSRSPSSADPMWANRHWSTRCSARSG